MPEVILSKLVLRCEGALCRKKRGHEREAESLWRLADNSRSEAALPECNILSKLVLRCEGALCRKKRGHEREAKSFRRLADSSRCEAELPEVQYFLIEGLRYAPARV